MILRQFWVSAFAQEAEPLLYQLRASRDGFCYGFLTFPHTRLRCFPRRSRPVRIRPSLPSKLRCLLSELPSAASNNSKRSSSSESSGRNEPRTWPSTRGLSCFVAFQFAGRPKLSCFMHDGTASSSSKSRGIRSSACLHLWFHHDEPATVPPPTSENVIVLSEAFYEEIDQHRIPVEREVVALLANAPGVLDLYVWLVWKTWSLNGQCVRIPLFGTGGLSDQLGTGDYSADRFFRRKIRRWLREVQALWPECPASVSKDGQSLVLYSAKRNPAVIAVKSPP